MNDTTPLLHYHIKTLSQPHSINLIKVSPGHNVIILKE